MSPAKKPAAPAKVATPSPEAAASLQARETASAPPSDPGPPPRMPSWPGSVLLGSLQDQLRTAAHQRDRDALAAVDTFRQPPQYQQYRAELLSWLDALDAYDEKNSN